MKIKEIEICAIKLPFIEPFVISYMSYETMPSIIVKITTDDGLVGYGEGVPDEHVTGETWESTYQVLQTMLAPKLIGQNPLNIEFIHELMDQTVFGVPTAKAAIDIACYDLMGKAMGVPVYVLLGGKYHQRFPLAFVLSIKSPEQMADDAEKRLEQGYRAFKIKVGTDIDNDIKRIRAVRERVGRDVGIRVDVNQGWQTSHASIKAMEMIKDLGIDWVEQPVAADDIDGMAEVKRKTTIPVMIDEGLHGKTRMREIIAKNAADKVNIKLMKCGGIYPALKLAHMAEMASIECQVGSMVESSIASAAGLHLAFSKKIIKSVETTGPLKFSRDIGNLRYDVPFVYVPEQPGLGIEVDEKALKELTNFSLRVK
jgi:Mandelate racemase / muconate lactonizing enzyme, N-terminal domain./Mandelate racemase / muconate lactonizing enzyme, C-terminal domain.